MGNESETEFFNKTVTNSTPGTVVIINCVLNAALIITSISGNSLVLAAISRTPSLRSPSIILLRSLAVSDLLVGLVVQPLFIAYELTKDGSLYEVLSVMSFTACGVSLLTMTAISVDRWMSLHYHMRYANLVTSRRAKYAAVILWCFSFLLSFLALWNMEVHFVTIGVSIAIFLVISLFRYIKIFRIVEHHQHQIYLQQQAVATFNVNYQNMQQSRKNAIDTFIYFIVMVLCYTPVITTMTMLGFSDIHLSNSYNLVDTVLFMNSSINPFLYCWRRRELRTAAIKTGRQILCKQTEGN